MITLTDEQALARLARYKEQIAGGGSRAEYQSALDHIASRLALVGGYRPAEIGDNVALMIPGTIKDGKIVPMQSFAKDGHEPVVPILLYSDVKAACEAYKAVYGIEVNDPGVAGIEAALESYRERLIAVLEPKT